MIPLAEVFFRIKKLEVLWDMKTTNPLSLEGNDVVNMKTLLPGLCIDLSDLLSVCPGWHSPALSYLAESPVDTL